MKNRPRVRRTKQPIYFAPLVPCANPNCEAKIDGTFYDDGLCGGCRRVRGLPPPRFKPSKRRRETRRDAAGPSTARPRRTTVMGHVDPRPPTKQERSPQGRRRERHRHPA
jgi:hypothetical protein